MTSKTLTQSDLAHFTGSERWFRHSMVRHILYTDGAQHVAEHGGAYAKRRLSPASFCKQLRENEPSINDIPQAALG